MGMIRNEKGMKFYYQQITDGENVVGHVFSFAPMWRQLNELYIERSSRNYQVRDVILKIEPPENAKRIKITHERYQRSVGNSFDSDDHHIMGTGQYRTYQLDGVTSLSSFALPAEWTPEEIQQLIAELSQCGVEYYNLYYED